MGPRHRFVFLAAVAASAYLSSSWVQAPGHLGSVAVGTAQTTERSADRAARATEPVH